MKTHFFISFIFLISIFSSEQLISQSDKNSINVNYKIKFKERVNNQSLDANTNNFFNESLKRKQEVIEDVIFRLDADREKYHFTYEEIMQSDNNKTTLDAAVSRAIDGSFIFTNLRDSISYLGGFDIGVKIHRKLSTNHLIWELTKEHKSILGIKCFKAVGSLVENDLAHSSSYPVIAWYSTSLNFYGGPTPFATLPGVILELETNQALIYAIDFKLQSEKVKNYVPKGKIMSYPDYLKFIQEWSSRNRKRN